MEKRSEVRIIVLTIYAKDNDVHLRKDDQRDGNNKHHVDDTFGGFLHGEHEQLESGNNLSLFKEAHEQYDEHAPRQQVSMVDAQSKRAEDACAEHLEYQR